MMMKRKNFTVFTIILLALFIYISILVEVRILTHTDYFIATSDLNVRSGAGTIHPVSFIIHEGEEVEILSKKDNWFYVRYGDDFGYAHSAYLKYNRTSPATISPSFHKTLKVLVIGILAGMIIIVGNKVYKNAAYKKLLNSVTKSNRGTRSERELIFKLLQWGIPAPSIFHDLYLKKVNGEYSQIDLVVITEVGIIVFEVKEYSGWIFGSGNQQQWTQVLAYGKQKYRLFNPILQNNKHIGELRKKLKHIDQIPFYSIVVFFGDCVLKDINYVPNGTYLVKSNRIPEVMRLITQNNHPVEYTNKHKIITTLKEAVQNGDNAEIQAQHIENIKDLLGKDRIIE